MDTPLTLANLKDLMLSPDRADDDPGMRLLPVDLTSSAEVGGEDLKRIGAWLGELPLPVIGITGERADGNGVHPRLNDAMDLIVTSNDDYTRVHEAIQRNPTTAAILVQVLRTVPHLTTHLALGVESLAYATLQGGAEFAHWLRTRPPIRPHPREDDASPVLLDRDDDHLLITLDSPSNRNALSVAMRDALTEAFKLVAMDASIASVEVRANGPSFSAGGDLTEFGSSTDLAMAHRIRAVRMPARYLAPHASRYTFHLHGACIGAGIELPAFAGRLVANENTVLRLPEVAMGLIPGAGGCVSISRRIGRQLTAWMAITGIEVTAHEALQWGLIDAIEP